MSVNDYVYKNTKSNVRNELSLERSCCETWTTRQAVVEGVMLLQDKQKQMLNGNNANMSVNRNGLSRKVIDENVKTASKRAREEKKAAQEAERAARKSRQEQIKEDN